MDKGDLDSQDRRNLYKPDAENIQVVEASVAEIIELIDTDVLDEVLIGALAEMQSDVDERRTKIAYVVIKISG